MVEASGDGPDEKDKEQEVNKVEDDDDDQVGDEGDVHTMEPKKKVGFYTLDRTIKLIDNKCAQGVLKM